MRVLVIRHAEQELPCAPAPEDPPLSRMGQQQAQRLAHALRGRHLGLVVSSNMIRARDTARAIASCLRVPHVVEAALAEIGLGHLAPWGAAEQVEWNRITASWAAGDLTRGCRGGENLTDVIARVSPLVPRLLSQADGRDFALVGHAVVNGVILSVLCPSLRSQLGKDLGQSHTGIWELAGEGTEFRVLRRDDTRHLGEYVRRAP